ncbi:MAG: CHASE2 domain-containing protein [Acidipila sp.]|nr:CHASE2 domain-containing protein [Acidipila sp.]
MADGKPDAPGSLFGSALGTLWRQRMSLLISLVVTLLGFFLYYYVLVGERNAATANLLTRLEYSTLDARFLLRPRFQAPRPDPRIVIVDIDQRAQEVLGRWPFSRSNFAKMLDALHDDGARVAGFDITFSKTDDSVRPLRELRARLLQKQGQKIDPRLESALVDLEKEFNADQQFADSIKRMGSVVLGNFFFSSQADLKGLDDATLDRYARLLAYFPYPQARAAHSAEGAKSFLDMIQKFDEQEILPLGAEANIEPLTDALGGDRGSTGFFNVWPDPDGIVRRANLAIPFGRSKNRSEWDIYASIDVQTVRYYLGLPNEKMILNFGSSGIENLEFGSSIIVVPDDIGRVMINFRGPVRTFPYVSIADVVNHTFPPGTFKDKIVLVGASATGIGDLRSTPFSSINYPGVEIHANVIDNILNQRFLQRDVTQIGVDLLLIFFFGVPLGLWLAVTQPKWMPLALLLELPFAAAVMFAFIHGWWLNFTLPTLVLLSNTMLVSLYRVLVEDREKRRVRGAFQQYVSPEVIRRVLTSPELVQPRKQEITILFSDIRGFTSISEKLDAQKLADLLNGYLTDMTRIVFRNQGTLDKYIGDAVMAFWGAPFEDSGHAHKAARAALDMLAKLTELQKIWKRDGLPLLDIGIGLNTGMASVGNMGSNLRYGYTAIGDAVNLAARLEGLNKEYGTRILLTEFAFRAARSPDFIFREVDVIRVKGKEQPVTIFELLGYRQEGSELQERVELYSRARSFYKRRDWRQAQTTFAKVLERWPDDVPSRVLFFRCEEFLLEEPDPQWDGVYVMKHK